MDNSSNLTNVQQAVLVSEVSIAKNYAIKSNNLSSETNADLNVLRTEVYSLENKVNNLTTKIQNLCTLLDNANLPNVSNNSLLYENL
tara:strand:+ start:624 stop:884 length:261 start_codon:yes stop_codon:yes gene_type:complete